MQNYLPVLTKCSLFQNISDADIVTLLRECACTMRQYQKGEVLLLAGYESSEIGIVLKGEIEAVKESEEGAAFPIARIGAGGIFSDILSGSRRVQSPVTVCAKTACTALFIPYRSLFQKSNVLGPAHATLLQNLVSTISEKYFALDRRLTLVLEKSLRRRLLQYLQHAARKAGSSTVELRLSRTALAAYLGCERSALSREITRMQNDGLIAVQKSRFTLLAPAALAHERQ